MLVLVNLNNYLGGGETLFVRMATYLDSHGISYKLFYPSKSYIADDLKKNKIGKEHLCPYSGDPNYYYLNENEKCSLLSFFENNLKGLNNVRLVSFCFRDLYTLADLGKKMDEITISHLILHDEDNLYLGQSLFDKFVYKFLHKKRHSNREVIQLNNYIFKVLNDCGALIGEKETTKIVMAKYGIQIEDNKIVPPPMCDFEPEPPYIKAGKKIIWIGRFVDFKLPAIVAMLRFVSTHKDYSLSLIGDGDIAYINKIVENERLELSNVNFLGAQPYNKIGEIIRKHSIGYACGTSIAEIGQYGLPVVTALFSPSHSLYKRNICGGIYNNKYKGNEGNNLLIGETEDQQPLIEDTLNQIELDFSNAVRQSYQSLRSDFDFSTNMNGYLSIINNSKRIEFNSIQLPQCSALRRFLYYKYR